MFLVESAIDQYMIFLFARMDKKRIYKLYISFKRHPCIDLNYSGNFEPPQPPLPIPVHFL